MKLDQRAILNPPSDGPVLSPATTQPPKRGATSESIRLAAKLDRELCKASPRVIEAVLIALCYAHGVAPQQLDAPKAGDFPP